MDIPVYFLSCAQELQSDVQQGIADARLQAEAAHQDINRVLQAVEQVHRLHSIDMVSA